MMCIPTVTVLMLPLPTVELGGEHNGTLVLETLHILFPLSRILSPQTPLL